MNGRFVRLYEQVFERSVALHPWLHTNILLSYECDRKQDRLLSLGIHLISGTIVESFYDVLKEKQWGVTVPDYCFTISPLIKPMSGLARLEAFVERLIASETHEWADGARARWEEDLALLQHFMKVSRRNKKNMKMKRKRCDKDMNREFTFQLLTVGYFICKRNKASALFSLK